MIALTLGLIGAPAHAEGKRDVRGFFIGMTANDAKTRASNKGPDERCSQDDSQLLCDDEKSFMLVVNFTKNLANKVVHDVMYNVLIPMPDGNFIELLISQYGRTQGTDGDLVWALLGGTIMTAEKKRTDRVRGTVWYILLNNEELDAADLAVIRNAVPMPKF